MRLFLLLLIPLIILSDFNFWEWTKNFTINNIVNPIENIANIVVTSTPTFVNEIKFKLIYFANFTEVKKNEIIETANNKLEELSQYLNNQKQKYYKPFLEKATETANYISLKICNITQLDSYENCRNDKKNFFSTLLNILKNELKCSKIVKVITTDILSDDYEQNLKNFLFFYNSITSNSDSLSRGKSIILYDVMNCLQEKFENYFSIILKKMKDITNNYIFSFKLDVTKLLIESFSKLVNTIHFEEIDGFIQKANEKTGLISSENAIKIQQNLFKFFKRLNEFGNKIYTFGPKILLNVTINPGNLEASVDGEIAIMDYKERGIKIQLHANYMLRSTGAYSLQTVIFDSPLVSIRGKKTSGGGTSNTFIGIRLVRNI